MKLIGITENGPFWSEVSALALEAFPPEEYLSPEKLVAMAREETFDFWALTEGDAFLGFMVVMTGYGMAYLFFLAIQAEFRAKGYGGQALTLLRETYPRMRQVVDLEMQDAAAENHGQRARRKQFYLCGGYKETGLFLSYLGVDYEVLCQDECLDTEAFKKLLATLRVEGFRPRYFRQDADGTRIEA